MMGANAFAKRRPGLQPDGFTVVLEDGSTIDNRQPLPDNLFSRTLSAAGPDSTPMGVPTSPQTMPSSFTQPGAPQPAPAQGMLGSRPASSSIIPGRPSLPGVPPVYGDMGGSFGKSIGPIGSRPAPDGADPQPMAALPSGRVPPSLADGMTSPQEALAGFQAPHIKPSFFSKDGLGGKIINGLDAFSTTYLANEGYPGAQAQLAQRLRQPELDRQFGLDKARQEWQRTKDMRPEIRSAGRSVISVPFEGQPSVLYSDPTDAARYAEQLGLTPDDPGYASAVQDYALRSYGPTAIGARSALEDQRQGDRVGLEGVRQQHRAALRGMPTYGNLHPANRGGGGGSGTAPPMTMSRVIAPILAKKAAGQPLTAFEQQALDYYRRPPGGGRRGGGEGQPVKVASPAQAAKLPPGTWFETPQGQIRQRH